MKEESKLKQDMKELDALYNQLLMQKEDFEKFEREKGTMYEEKLKLQKELEQCKNDWKTEIN